MRRVKPDPIPLDVQARILDAAIRAPSGGNQQNWRFLLLDDPAKKAALAPLYQHAMGQLWETVYKSQLDAARPTRTPPSRSRSFGSSARPSGWPTTSPRCRSSSSRSASTTPAVVPSSRRYGAPCWPPGPRASGVASPRFLQFFHPAETLEILGVPDDQGWILTATA
jgi:nitroreductase